MRKFYFLVLGLLIFSGVKAQIVNIPDANFKANLLAAKSFNSIAKDLSGNFFKIDANNDSQIQESEALQVGYLSVSKANISSILGIEKFTNLQSLDCSYNKLATLDLSGLTSLQSLDCSYNQFTSLDVSSLTNLQKLVCKYNQLTSLDVSGLTNLQRLFCNYNQLTTLDISGLANLLALDCSINSLTSINASGLTNLQSLDSHENQLTSLNLNGLINLQTLNCNNNKLTNLDVSGLANLLRLYSDYNQLTNIDLSKLRKLFDLDLSSNQLTSLDLNLPYLTTVLIYYNNLQTLFIKNTNSNLFIDYRSDINFIGNPNLKYICVKESEIEQAQKKAIAMGITNCVVSSYCTFVPDGQYFDITGNSKLDSNSNGCDETDINYPNLKYAISNGTVSGSTIADITGYYYIPVKSGTHTITPVLENSNYFTVSPTNTIVTFPTATSPFTQDFCITPNGIYPDLEVTVLPINRARPGFDATYKIVYKNKGNQTQSGSVNLKFNDAVLDLVSASPVVTNQNTNTISWDFSDLKPFETREIAVTLNVNSPIETPAVNNNDILSYTATITSTQTDDTPTDNTFTLNQTVVGSFDPNDKTCLEGATIPPSAVGKYVHYLIRFENKGTAEAQNVVVKDMIDTEKFDVSSLVVTQGSHPFVTRITETNKVEFIFENINLPFDDATNDGYVAFKIKTKPSLVVGDSFSNTASIYFDYNFPIVTNTATTSVLQSLGTNDFEFDSYFKIYPNPVKNNLNLDIKKQITVSSISIYNTLGQQLLVIPNAQYTKQVDVSNLKTGNYFIKLTSDKGSSVGKFIKS